MRQSDVMRIRIIVRSRQKDCPAWLVDRSQHEIDGFGSAIRDDELLGFGIRILLGQFTPQSNTPLNGAVFEVAEFLEYLEGLFRRRQIRLPGTEGNERFVAFPDEKRGSGDRQGHRAILAPPPLAAQPKRLCD